MAQLIDKFYSYLQEEVAVRQAASEEGDTQEQAFTRIAAEMLSEAGEVEGVTVAYDEKEIGKKGQHKINGYAIADDYETLDLFISIYNSASTIQSVPKASIDLLLARLRASVIGVWEVDWASLMGIYTSVKKLLRIVYHKLIHKTMYFSKMIRRFYCD